jgi:putative alpha-1,2-mannosidase
MTINGAPYDCAFVTHDMFTAGGTWEFYVGSAPNTTWGQTINCTF